MGSRPCETSQRLAALKCPQPMKGEGGREADKGEGWWAQSTKWVPGRPVSRVCA